MCRKAGWLNEVTRLDHAYESLRPHSCVEMVLSYYQPAYVVSQNSC